MASVQAARAARETVERVYRDESRRVLATLIRLLGDFDIAEEALHDAFIAAVEQWPAEGVPRNPRAWLVSAGRFKAIDKIRRRARFDVPLEDMAERIEEIPRALRSFGPYAIQAAIAAVDAESIDWAQIVALYDVLLRLDASPVVELNRAVAVAMRDGPAAGLEIVDELLARGELAEYRLSHAARADLCRRLGKKAEAQRAHRQALRMTGQAAERRFLERRLAELEQ